MLSLAFGWSEFIFTKRTLKRFLVMFVHMSGQINASVKWLSTNSAFIWLVFAMGLHVSTISWRYIKRSPANFTWIRCVVMLLFVRAQQWIAEETFPTIVTLEGFLEKKSSVNVSRNLSRFFWHKMNDSLPHQYAFVHEFFWNSFC